MTRHDKAWIVVIAFELVAIVIVLLVVGQPR